MSLISGIVNNLEDGVVKTGHFAGSAFKTVVLTTGNRLTCFDTSFITGVEVGKEYTFPVEQKGQYINIVGAVTPVIQTAGFHPSDGLPVDPSTGALGQEVKPAEEVLPKVHTPTDERGFKNRISALASAVEFLSGFEDDHGGARFSVGDVTITAEEFLKFINGE